MKILLAICVLLAIIGSVLFIGYTQAYVDDELKTRFFRKKHATFQLEFRNPYAHEGEDVPLPLLDAKEKRDLIEYCKYRWGIEDASDTSLQRCGSQPM
ncbi:hypothetical protein [Amantichitinum ursilacus]|uniref:Uncharacterized protein n=1 Tax=Amantichitinum ursilacus TaxID=857265 RepID=A0A0N0GLP0_9NEIS|nr:hypothetical protein [Amantichitinum ursilacus]KPC50288.1 hypothetical protein WG78_17995 [Amantichitinum ursilacus]